MTDEEFWKELKKRAVDEECVWYRYQNNYR